MIPAQLLTNLNDKLAAALAQLKASSDLQKLYDAKVAFAGKQGFLSEIMREMAKLSKEEKPLFGKEVNRVKDEFEKAYTAREDELKSAALLDKVNKERIDVSLPGAHLQAGAKHPIAMVMDDVIAILARLGYTVRTGPQIEKDWYNFEALNIPPDHPARDMQDTFYIDADHVLRTHTSPIQIHTLLSEKPPFRALAPGSVYRCDSDVSHSPNFHQIEGLLVDRQVSMADLKGTITFLLRELFGSAVNVRFRPSFFPFTEPSAEFDCSCPVCVGKGCRLCKQSGWIEIGGSGLVNPRVFEAVKLDPKQWQGFAFGFGIERMAIIKYGIDDIRLFYENDQRFLRQFNV
ncbi:MAG: phenylalanine--tRNA ligase subunit alpha [Bdellovibrionales bacterium]|nr:phenylalanine--tRNA ligase subunit alpha [Bdellovibrionales bacterium]